MRMECRKIGEIMAGEKGKTVLSNISGLAENLDAGEALSQAVEPGAGVV